MRTIIYARYSSHLQNARSIEDQVAVCRERAGREGWPIVAVHTDAAIGGGAGTGEHQRPGLNALLARVEAGGVDQVLADTTSRIARNQGDGHHIRDLLNFFGCRLFTLADGEVDAFKGAIKGLLDEHQRKELAHNIRRGQRGSVRAGRVAAGLAFGYRIANALDGKGGLVRGLREIDDAQAAIVRRIFREYAAGLSPRAIAAGLNRDGVPGPRGKGWRGSTIGGDRVRGNGILQNRAYVGEIVHARTSKVADPRTRKTLIRPNDPASHARGAAAHLRIVDQDLWEKVQALRTRFAQLGARGAKRPRHLLSGLVHCGVCGGRYQVVAARLWQCGRYHDGRACANGRQIETQTLEARVLAGMQGKLLDPEAVSLWVREYTAEHGRARRAIARDRRRLEASADEADRRIARLVEAIAGGADMAEVRDALAAARAQRDAARAASAEIDAEESVVTLHPRLAERYRDFVADLLGALKDPEQLLESVPILRSLIERVVLTPARKGRGCDVRLEGRLSTILAAAAGAPESLPTVTAERVKGTRRRHRFLSAKV